MLPHGCFLLLKNERKPHAELFPIFEKQLPSDFGTQLGMSQKYYISGIIDLLSCAFRVMYVVPKRKETQSMSKDWTPEELQAASTAMQQMGNLSYEEFCKEIEEAERMEVKFDLTGTTRKGLVKAAEQIVDAKAIYKKLPTLGYELAGFTFTKDGLLIWDESIAPEAAERLVTALTEQGFKVLGDAAEPPTEGETAPAELVISLPNDSFTDTALANLDKIIEVKGTLIKKALGADSIAYEVTDDAINFPWFLLAPDADAVTAYTKFIAALGKMCKEKKRITAKEKPVENEKYAFRCFLLSLGFIGNEYKANRKILLSRLDGNSAWKSGRPK